MAVKVKLLQKKISGGRKTLYLDFYPAIISLKTGKETRREFLGLVRQLHDAGLTIVMVSHAMDDLAELADRVLVLDGGRLVGLDTPRAIFERADALASIGLAAPSACLLAERLSKRGLPIPADLYDERTITEVIARALR